MKNKVVAGDFQYWDVVFRGNKLYFMHRLTKQEICKNDVARFETVNSGRKSFLVSLEFVDGRRSLLEVDMAVYKGIFCALGF